MKIPEWCQMGPFRYNLRFFVGALPSLLLVTTVGGKMHVTSSYPAINSQTVKTYDTRLITSFSFFLQYGSCYPAWNIDHTSPQKHPDAMAVRHIRY